LSYEYPGERPGVISFLRENEIAEAFLEEERIAAGRRARK